jgi:hypothetical protein
MKKRQSGTMLLEFVLTGIPALFITVSVFEASMTMWQYHTMAETVQVAGRYIVTHGQSCSQNGNNCSITVANIVTDIESTDVGLDPSRLNVTLAGLNNTVTCNPLTYCANNSTVFPEGNDGAAGNNITVTATYPMKNPFVIYWPGAATVAGSNITLGANSIQRIMF